MPGSRLPDYGRAENVGTSRNGLGVKKKRAGRAKGSYSDFLFQNHPGKEEGKLVERGQACGKSEVGELNYLLVNNTIL